MAKCNQPTKYGNPCQHTVTKASGCGADHGMVATAVVASVPSGSAAAVIDPLAGAATDQIVSSKRQAIREIAERTAPLLHTRNLSVIQQHNVAESAAGSATTIAKAIRQMRTDDPTGSHHIDNPSTPPIPDGLTGRAAMAKAATHLIKAHRSIDSADRLLAMSPADRETCLIRAEGRARAAAVLYARAAADLKAKLDDDSIAPPTVEKAFDGAGRALMAARSQSLDSKTRRGAADGALWATTMHLRNAIDAMGVDPAHIDDGPPSKSKDTGALIGAAKERMDLAHDRMAGFANDDTDGRAQRLVDAHKAVHEARLLFQQADNY